MNAKQLNQTIAGLILLLTTVTGLAQDAQPTPDAPPPPPEYEIELIVFEYVGGVVGSREDWDYIDTGRAQKQAELDAIADALVESEPIPIEVMEPDTQEPTPERLPLEFTPLIRDDFLLPDIETKMRNSRDYRPIYHAAWRQVIYDAANESPLPIGRVGQPPESLTGDTSIYVSRFLHLKLDLQLTKTRTGENGEPMAPLVYTLNERRKMRSGELHFFDHPRFGAVVLISRTD
ncbi:MAG: CsiV family protein [Pseudomonadota bacterium]